MGGGTQTKSRGWTVCEFKWKGGRGAAWQKKRGKRGASPPF